MESHFGLSSETLKSSLHGKFALIRQLVLMRTTQFRPQKYWLWLLCLGIMIDLFSQNCSLFQQATQVCSLYPGTIFCLMPPFSDMFVSLAIFGLFGYLSVSAFVHAKICLLGNDMIIGALGVSTARSVSEKAFLRRRTRLSLVKES